MATTLKQARDLIKLDCNVSEANEFTNARINKYINLAKDSIQGMLYKFGLKTLDAEITLTGASIFSEGRFLGETYSSIAKSAITSLMEFEGSIRGIQTVQGTTPAYYGFAKEVDFKNIKNFILNPYTEPTVNEPIFSEVNTNVYIFPAVTTATIYYYKKHPDLALDSDTIAYPSFAHEFVIKKAKALVYEALGQKEKALVTEREVDNELQKAYADYKTGNNESAQRKLEKK